MDPAFEFTMVHSKDSARAAVHTIVMRMWGGMLRVQAFLTPLCIGGAVWLVRATEDARWYWSLLPLVLGHAGQAYLIWAQSRRLMKTLKGSARVTLSESDFGIVSEKGSHVMPWTVFKACHRNSRNVLLFLSKNAAIVVPTNDVSGAAVEFMLEHAPSRKRESWPR
ncbi:MAG: YcxB family protein [Gammaproteobacteria bacterium]